MLKIAYTIKGWIKEKNKDMDIYKGLVQYTLFFAPFFDGKMEYIQHKNSLRAVRKVLKIYGTGILLEKKVFWNFRRPEECLS